ncbi:hypothetical protein BWQ96_05856 [Gracilariopsis chorda]|uniref:Uncharacterized protein n=1 Tax=Gracilariopsis chorda TaxID=448386 RepID=A0A2V3IQP9_9FLOR|nr:hypothetical protein BWQ96_05856 [Gracilariopsis chorda]|eukprot:PXF44413.1 hypothetical protein BWQ96_05856 [Gracilariopsis chorda]
MPSAKYLRDSGRKDIDNAVTNLGGYRKVASMLGWSPRKSKRPPGFWEDFSNVESELLRFIENSKLGLAPRFMPTLKQLRDCRRSDLVGAIEKNGGVAAVAEKLNLRRVVEHKPKKYWSDWMIVESEIRAFVENQEGERNGDSTRKGQVSRMPSLRELRAAGRGDLAEGIVKYHGGFRAVASKLNLAPKKKNDFFYVQFYNVAREVYTLTKDIGTDGVMPYSIVLRAAKRSDLAAAIVKFGGMSKVSQRLGLQYRMRTKGVLKDWDVFRLSLSEFMRTLNNTKEIPPSQTLAKFGRADLYQAILHHGGANEVADRMGLKRNYWQDFCYVGAEVLNFIAVHGTEGVMPTENEFREVGRSALDVAVSKFGRSEVAGRLGLVEQASGTNIQHGETEYFQSKSTNSQGDSYACEE